MSTCRQRRGCVVDDRTRGTTWPGAPERSPSSPAPVCGRSGTTTTSGCSPSPSGRRTGTSSTASHTWSGSCASPASTNLGLSLSQIADLGDADEHPEDALRTLDAELAATIEQLHRVRLELALILRRPTPTDLPPELAPPPPGSPTADRSFVVVAEQGPGSSGHDRTMATCCAICPAIPSTPSSTSSPPTRTRRPAETSPSAWPRYVRPLYAEHPGRAGRRRATRPAVLASPPRRSASRCRSCTTKLRSTSCAAHIRQLRLRGSSG